MTDGIIRQVLEMYTNNVHEDVIEDMITELVKKIKQEITISDIQFNNNYLSSPYRTGYNNALYDISKKLIGDNKQ